MALSALQICMKWAYGCQFSGRLPLPSPQRFRQRWISFLMVSLCTWSTFSPSSTLHRGLVKFQFYVGVVVPIPSLILSEGPAASSPEPHGFTSQILYFPDWRTALLLRLLASVQRLGSGFPVPACLTLENSFS